MITVYKSGNLISIANLDKGLRDKIEPVLSYMHKRYLRGADRRDPITGYNKGPFEFIECKLYKYDMLDRLCCGVGFLKKLIGILKYTNTPFKVINQDPVKDNPDCYYENWDLVVSKFTFRPRQSDCLTRIAANEYGIIKAPTGFGKGVIIAMACCLYSKAKIDVIMPGRDLVEKTVKILIKYLPNIGQVGCGRKQVERITVYSADSLHLSNGEADIILADEIHMLAANSYAENLAKYRNSRNFGFSATPTGRLDGADAKLESLFGNIIFDLSYQEAVKLNLVVPIVVDWLNVNMSSNPCEGKNDTTKKRWGIWRNEYRNNLIANKAKSYHDDDQVLILVETVEHLMYLRQYLPDFKVCYSEGGLDDKTAKMYKRNKLMPEDEEIIDRAAREQLRLDFESGKIKKAIATSVWSTGVDFEQLAVLIRADAMGSEILDTQAPGRVSRKYLNKPYGIVVDCMDNFDQSLRRKSNSRRQSYAKHGWKQHTTKPVPTIRNKADEDTKL